MDRRLIDKALEIYRVSGLMGLYRATAQRLRPRRAGRLRRCIAAVKGKKGLEIGGPSPIFTPTGLLPLYPAVGSLDNCNFAASTIWDENVHVGTATYRYCAKHAPGNQFLGEASNLAEVPSASYDFVLSSHVIEHVANPLKALLEWLRVLKAGGVLVLVVPHRDGAFDHRRPVTRFDHLMEDLARDVGEDDCTHLEEILALHDLQRDPQAGTFSQFKLRSERNAENRCLHHHVFDLKLVASMLEHAGFEALALEDAAPEHLVALARKLR